MQSLMLMWNKRNYNLFSLYIPIATRLARRNLSNKVGQLIFYLMIMFIYLLKHNICKYILNVNTLLNLQEV